MTGPERPRTASEGPTTDPERPTTKSGRPKTVTERPATGSEQAIRDWPTIHENVVRQFRGAWDNPDPHAWDGFLDESVRFVQPMLCDGVGPELWWEEFARTQVLLPNLRVEVLRWAGSEDTVFIHIRFAATAGGRPLTWEAVDLLKLSPEGKLLFRESFFDSSHPRQPSSAAPAPGSPGGAPA
ncbi:nuclear transport factor 2 family protein [Kribbella sp. HUAS MG21]|uniref:Nuclear transport factor 2 family protein n=1 Tax=Kribbella sp. HUAS MG21 TaxID=3160966 RepID=A0AAU7TH29_9ACTN